MNDDSFLRYKATRIHPQRRNLLADAIFSFHESLIRKKNMRRFIVKRRIRVLKLRDILAARFIGQCTCQQPAMDMDALMTRTLSLDILFVSRLRSGS